MKKARPTRRGGDILDATVAVFACILILSGFGIWQLDRKTWKENLIATLNARLGSAPKDLPPRASWSRLREDSDEFRRVAFPAEFLDGEEALVYTAGSSLRPDVKGPGYWVFAPARLAGGSIILINRGFVPDDRKDPATRAEGAPHGIVDFVGVMRWPEKRNSFTPPDDPDKGVWYLREFKFDRCSQEVGDRRAVLYRSGRAGADRGFSETWQARSAFDRQPPAVCHHLVRARVGARRGLCRLARAPSFWAEIAFLVKAPARGYCAAANIGATRS